MLRNCSWHNASFAKQTSMPEQIST